MSIFALYNQNKTALEFKEFGFDERLLEGIDAMNYTKATPVQEQVIPIIQAGKDLIASAQTGTGKTAAFLLPIIHELITAEKHEDEINALVIVPTRELAVQIEQNLEAFSYFTPVSSIAVYGGGDGSSFETEKKALSHGVDFVICTPGRMISHLASGYVKTKGLKHLILDEADRMLDMGFINDMRKVITKLPAKKQTMFFSATAAPNIMQLANTILKNPVSVSVNPVSSTAPAIKQSVYFVQRPQKSALLKHILKTDKIDHVLIFTRTKRGADKVAKDLKGINIKAEAIHGNKSQTAREKALKGFKDRTVSVLVATDIASRGIDVDKLTHVINYEIPEQAENYVHRIGRTGRAGETGEAVSLCSTEELAYFRGIQKLIKKDIEVIKKHPYL